MGWRAVANVFFSLQLFIRLESYYFLVQFFIIVIIWFCIYFKSFVIFRYVSMIFDENRSRSDRIQFHMRTNGWWRWRQPPPPPSMTNQRQRTPLMGHVVVRSNRTQWPAFIFLFYQTHKTENNFIERLQLKWESPCAHQRWAHRNDNDWWKTTIPIQWPLTIPILNTRPMAPHSGRPATHRVLAAHSEQSNCFDLIKGSGRSRVAASFYWLHGRH